MFPYTSNKKSVDFLLQAHALKHWPFYWLWHRLLFSCCLLPSKGDTISADWPSPRQKDNNIYTVYTQHSQYITLSFSYFNHCCVDCHLPVSISTEVFLFVEFHQFWKILWVTSWWIHGSVLSGPTGLSSQSSAFWGVWQKWQVSVQHQLSSCVILQQYCLHSHGPPVQRLPRNAYYTMVQGGGGRRLSLIDLPAAGSQWHANNTNTLCGYSIDIGREFHGSDQWAGGLPADNRLGAKASRVCDLLHWVSSFRRNCSPGSYKGRISTYRSVNMQGDWKNKQGCSMTTCCWTVLLCAGRMTQSQWRTFL